MDKIELKECPFCGEKKELWICYQNIDESRFIQCQRCGCIGPKVCPFTVGGDHLLAENYSKELWNERSKDKIKGC